ncbi:hypothetical protein AXX16_1626 [Serratia rubidaea]|nr:hypothetical protein AXX16_1626 [Serratia rubidaea]
MHARSKYNIRINLTLIFYKNQKNKNNYLNIHTDEAGI